MMVDYHYILDENDLAVPCPDPIEWAQWMERVDRHVARTDIRLGKSKRVYTVSTVFLGLDHGFAWWRGQEAYQPILFETMIHFVDQVYHPRYGSWLNFQERYRTWTEAEAGHWDAVRRFQAGELSHGN